MKTVKLPHFSCQKCHYRWVPRHEHAPKVCPKCKCDKWHNYTPKALDTDKK